MSEGLPNPNKSTKFTDLIVSGTSNSVSINADPLTSDYKVTLPAVPPNDRQLLEYNENLGKFIWADSDAAITLLSYPTARSLQVSKIGSDLTGTGTILNPFLTIKKAITVALSIDDLTSYANQICINVASGRYLEDNTSGPIEITKSGISIIGESSRAVMVEPLIQTNGLILLSSKNIDIENIRFQANYSAFISSAPCIVATGTFNINIFNCMFLYFGTAISTLGSDSISTYMHVSDCMFLYNLLAIHAEGLQMLIQNSNITGSTSIVPTGQNGVYSSGSLTITHLSNTIVAKCTVGLTSASNSYNYISSSSFINNKTHILANTQSNLTIDTVIITKMNSGDIGIRSIDSGTIINCTAATINGENYSGDIYGTGIYLSTAATINVISCFINNCIDGIIVGDINSSDTQTTLLKLKLIVFSSNNTDIKQYGSSSLSIQSANIYLDKILIENTINFNISAFDEYDRCPINGKLEDIDTNIFGIGVSTEETHPLVTYKTNLYNNKTYGYETRTANSSTTHNISNNDSSFAAITKQLLSTAGIKLFSDESSTLGNGSLLRGWTIEKSASASTLDFIYQNNNNNNQSIIEPYQFLSFDAVNKYVTYDLDTILKYGNDITLFRDSSGVLKTNAAFVANDLSALNLTAFRAIALDANKKIISLTTTSNELEYVSGVTSAIQTQFTNKLNLSGGTLTGQLILPSGSSTVPQLKFINGTSGISSSIANTLNFIVSGQEAINIASNTTVTISNGLTLSALTSSGVIHNNSSGVISSSLITNSDITNTSISNGKLATVTSGNTTNYIVSRDGSGNFSANMISLDGTPTNLTDVVTKSYVDTAITTGVDVHGPARVVVDADTNSAISGLLTIGGVTLVDSDRVLLTSQTDSKENGLWSAHVGAWTRTADFNTGDLASGTYVLILEGSSFSGSSWLCNTPSAVIDTDVIQFVQFSLPIIVSGTTVGVGTGNIYKGVSSNVLQFRSLLAGTNVLISNNTNEVVINLNSSSVNNANEVVSRDGSGDFAAGVITASLIGSVTGASSDNVLKSGDTMTGSLVIPTGTVGSPSLYFTGGTNSGLSMADVNEIIIGIGGIEISKWTSTGMTISNLTAVGIVHNSAVGLLSTSLIVDADIDNAANILDTKLATISTASKVSNSATTATSANSLSTIVARDGAGNFSAGIITASLTGSVTGASSDNVLKSGDTMTGSLVIPTGSIASPSLKFGNTSQGIASISSGLSFTSNSLERINISSSGGISIIPFNVVGIVHNSADGLLSTSLIVNADIDNAANILDTKLATISTASKVSNSATTATSANSLSTIVARDDAGNFSAGIITALLTGSVTGASSDNVLKSGDTMTGSLVIPTGSSAAPSLNFTGSATTGLSAITDILSLNTSGIQRMSINAAGGITIPDLSLIGIVNTDATGLLSTSNLSGAVTSTGTSTLITNTFLSSTISTDTSSTTYVLLPGMSTTPAAGTYMLWFSSIITSSNNNRLISTAVYKAGVIIADSIRSISCNSNFYDTITTQTKFTCTGTDLISVYWNISNNTATATERSIMLLRVA
jgi:hypothetical protein